ncbi:uncharacterized protein N7500_010084 [Penicillium coprophilum]|uniref:uncharacterized protein n=1 Tax=Penicillium coprophilum TaxID=36646 RepID=UPI002393D28C|nr:uncharacterized protein N7500_010084 [Penicillium coprophilum]KAJ5154645.1 hypothetical protein N7500_010084 [Penicillium coprophilum]
MGKVNQKVLIDVMEEASDESHIRLDLSYGEPEPPTEQYWFSVKGQEVGCLDHLLLMGEKMLIQSKQVLVVNPVEIPQLKAELDDIMESIHKMAAPDQRSRSPDIFDRLPVELRNWVFEFLPAGSIVALKAASLAMHSTTLSGECWKRRLRTELPWLWEIHDIDIFQSQEVEERASKLLLNIEKKSLYTSESDDYIFGLANRRRIWGVCEQLRSRYLQKLEGIANT